MRVWVSVILIILFFSSVGSQTPLDIWDMDYLTDATTLDVDTVWATDTVVTGLNFKIGEIRYSSIGDPGRIIRIQAFFAVPEGENQPGILLGHGVGDSGSILYALSVAVAFRGVALSISGPGCGGSDGQSPEPLNWIRTYPDPRCSWIYQYVCAGARGITYLRALPQVDPNFICAMGYSAGGIMCWLLNGIDDRIKLAIPHMSSGDWLTSIRNHSWLYYSIGDTIPESDPRITNLLNFLDPMRYSSTQRGLVFFSIGAQDEFFPINSVANHFRALNQLRSRVLIVGNWDHATYYGADPRYSGRYDAFDNSANALRKMVQASLAVFNAVRLAGIVPPPPQVRTTQIGNSITFTAISLPGLNDSLFLWVSLDSAWTFRSFRMGQISSTTFTYTLNLSQGWSLENIIYFVEAYGTGFILSSAPYVPSGMHVRIRPPREFSGIAESQQQTTSQEIIVYPFPSRGYVSFSFAGNRTSFKIFDIAGHLVVEIKNSEVWDGKTKDGMPVPSGLYFVKGISEEGKIFEGKIMLVR